MRDLGADARIGRTRAAIPSIRFAGDRLAALDDLVRMVGPADPAAEHPVTRALVIGVDASTGGLRRGGSSARRLRAVRVPDHLPSLAHVVIVMDGWAGAIPGDRRALEARVARLHADLERTRGADVAVTGILASACASPRLLSNRIVDLVQHPVVAAHLAVEWADIRDRRIRDVALERIC